jgi:hypothetical protein
MPTDIPHAWQKRILPSELNTSSNSNTQWCKWGMALGFYFLDVCAKSQEGQPFRFIMSVCPCWTICLLLDSFQEIWYLSIFLKSVMKIWVSLKYDKNNRYNTWRPMYTYISIIILLRIRNVSDRNCRDNQNTLFMLNNFFLKIVPFMRLSGKIWYHQTTQRWQYNTTHVLCMLEN